MTSALFHGKKVALVHDWLNGMRGGEKCLEVFCELFPNADVYTLLYEPGKLSPRIESMRIIPSFIQRLPYSLKAYRYYLPLFPVAIEQFNLRDYDVVLSSSHCVAKGVRHQEHAYHICYLHAPMRYMWSSFDTYFARGRTSRLVYLMARASRPYLQRWDRQSCVRVHTFLCNSRHTQEQVQRYYGRLAQVIHPPVDLSRFQPGPAKENYYLMVGAFAPNKRVDLAIRAFNALKYPLKIVGGGQNESYYRTLAHPHIEFVGGAQDHTISELYRKARAFVFPGEDDFGITPLEAQASGTPVIAYAKGGALETVTEKTGVFFHEPTVESLCAAVRRMERTWQRFSPQRCVQQAQRFGRERYKQQILTAVERGYQQWLTAGRKKLSP